MARRATSLGPKPSLFIISFLLGWVCFLLSFLCFSLQKNWVSPPRKGHFCLFLSLSLCFSLAFFGLPLFQFLFLCLSLVLFFCLPCLFCLLSFGSFFLSLSFLLFLLFAFVSWKEQHQGILIAISFLSSIFSLLGGGGSCLVFPFQIPFSYLCVLLFFPDFELYFLFNMNVLGFKTNNTKNTIFWSRGGLQQNAFFYQPVFSKCEKVIVFWGGPSLGQFWLMFKKTL